MSEPVGEIGYRGAIQVRPYRRGTYLGDEYLDSLIERALRALMAVSLAGVTLRVGGAACMVVSAWEWR